MSAHTPKKTTVKKTVSRKAAVKPVQKVPSTHEPEVTLPAQMSSRSIEKSLVLQKEYAEILNNAMVKIAYVSGLCFALVGTSVIAHTYFGGSPNTHTYLQSAQVISTSQTPLSTIEPIDVSADDEFRDDQDTISSLDKEIERTTDDPEDTSDKESLLQEKEDTDSSGTVTEDATLTKTNLISSTEESDEDFTKTYVENEADLIAAAEDLLQEKQLAAVTEEQEEVEKLNETDMTNEPLVSLVSQIDDNPTGDFVVKIKVLHLNEVRFFLTRIDETGVISLQAQADGDYYKVKVPAAALPNGAYRLSLAGKDLQGTPYTRVFQSRTFTVGMNQDDEDLDKDDDDEQELKEESDTEDEEDKPDFDEIKSDFQRDDTIGEDPIELQRRNEIKISSAQSEIRGTITLGLSAPTETTALDLYYRPLSSTESVYVTSAERWGTKNQYWRVIVNTKNIPNGTHEFYVLGTVTGTKQKSNQIKLTVTNRPTVDPKPPVDTLPVANRPEAIDGGDITTVDPAVTLERSITEAAREALKRNEQDINDLMRRYAAAKQAGDESLIAAIEELIEQKRNDISETALNDTAKRDIADDIDEQIAQKFVKLKEKVESFEEVRKIKSEGITAIDTDGDGISDYDERLIYKTDPTIADSDNDGINDGVEIIRGFNPNDSAAEAVIRFESPKETVGLTRPDVMKVDTVTPVESLEDQATGPVKTQIRGQALPNSFVTLYIFSNPTVVTIKTDADGSFVYTFDKELEDGSHDVYVAVTDNAGEIIAHSEPFSFIKEARAFTPVVDAAEADTVTVREVLVTEDDSPYSVAIGIGILAFGVILLMLGISLRPEDKVVITEKEPV